MSTPNIEELINNLTIKAGVMEMGEKIAWGSDTALMRQAAATLQSQAERIAELERESETHAKAYGLAIVERDNLRHELKTAQEGWRCECSTDDAIQVQCDLDQGYSKSLALAQMVQVELSKEALTAGRAVLANAERVEPEPKLWLWKNFVDGKQEYWAFDNLYPINMNDDDPQTLGDPCGYALLKPSRNGRKDTP